MDCTFCKKSATQLTPHNLCSLCLVHVECCEIDDILSSDDDGGTSPPSNDACDEQMEKVPPPVPKDAPSSRVECDICLEQIQQTEIEQHREMCSPRIALRCSICGFDYLSKEGLWNHLDFHEIVDEDKELNYNEVRITQELQKCVLCNDQRGYVEKKYWEHVHEDHDGYFLRCLDCGESFRSKKQYTNHTLRNCKAVERTGGPDVISLNLPLQINVLANFSKLYERAQGNPTNLDIISFIREKDDPVDIKPDISKINVGSQSCEKEMTSEKDSQNREDCDTRENSSLKRKYQQDNTFSCGMCGESCKDFHSLALHVKQLHYEEANCQKLLDALDESDRVEDKSQFTDNEQVKIPVKSCPICGEIIRHPGLLTLHVKNNHQMITCSSCGEIYIAVGQKAQNLQSTQTGAPLLDPENSIKQRGIKCRCYSGTWDVDDHRDQSTDPRFQCPCCAEKFHEKKQLQRHMTEHVHEIIHKKYVKTSPSKDKSKSPSISDSKQEQTSAIEETPNVIPALTYFTQ